MYNLNICHLYADILNIYGDRGNVIALNKRAQWRGIDVNVIYVTLGDSFIPNEYDIVFIGGGQDYEQGIILEDLLLYKGNDIKHAVENNKVFLCICKGYELFGKYLIAPDGTKTEYLGVLDTWTESGQGRLTGNIVFECDFLKSETYDGKIIGFENHSGRTFLGPGAKPLGRVIKGFGNNGEDRYEGAVYKNVYCSYSHGSLLPKNPELADYLITLALKQKYNDFKELPPLDDELEKLAHDSMVNRILK